MIGLKHEPLSPSQRFSLLALFVLAFVLRLYEVDNLLLDRPSMRQGHTALIARNFYENGMNPLQPDIGGNGHTPYIWYNEYSLFPYFVAAIYQVSGEAPVMARLLNILFSLGAMAVLFRLTRRYCGNNAALFALAVFAITPLSVYFSRTIQRQMMVLFFGLLMLDEFDRWLIHRRARHYLVAAGAGALAVLSNPPIAHLGLPMIYLALLRSGLLDRFSSSPSEEDDNDCQPAQDVFTTPETKTTRISFGLIFKCLALGVIILIPAALWYTRSLEDASSWSLQPGSRDPNLHFRNFSDPGYYLVWFSPGFFQTVWRTFANEVLTLPLTVVAFLGVLTLWSRIPKLFYIWFLAVFIYFCLDVNPIYIGVHSYYYLNALPVLAVFAGVGLAIIWNLRTRLPGPLHPVLFKFPVLALLVVTCWLGFRANAILYKYETGLEDVPAAMHGVQLTIPEDGLIFMDLFAPEAFYLLDRKGWYNPANVLSPEYFERLRAQGCEYLVLFSRYPAEETPALREYLDANTLLQFDHETFRIRRFKHSG